jgi:NIPSNAP
MLLEHRTYTMKPGNLQRFIDAQITRGFPPMQPILDRLVGYFGTIGGPDDQMVHLYRFDSYDDWQTRLHGLYTIPGLEPYFTTVRPLMLAQENKFLVPAPVPSLTPFLGNGKDWLPGQSTLGKMNANWLITETTTNLFPGSLPKLWQAARDARLEADPVASAHLFGTFYSLVGRLHQVITYRYYPSLDARETHRVALAENKTWRGFIDIVGSLSAQSETKLLRPAQVAQMSPLFQF